MAELIEVTRQELYDLVWSMPLARVAAKLGMAHATTKKLCQESVIPLPPPGYWRQSPVTRESNRTPLPAAGPERIWKRRSLKRSRQSTGPAVTPSPRPGRHTCTTLTASALVDGPERAGASALCMQAVAAPAIATSASVLRLFFIGSWRS